MKSWNTTLTAAEAIAIGACDGRCMVASKDVCDCVCGGAYHGVLAAAAVGEITHTARPANEAAKRAVRRHKAPEFESRAAEAVAAEFIQMRVDGRTYREISEATGVSRSIVDRRLREFAQGGES